MEFPAAVVGAGADEVRQHLVGVGGAHQLADGQAHFPGVIGSKNVAEIPGGHHHVHGLAQDALPLPDKLQIGIDVVDDLGQQPAPVDGVGAGEQHAVRFQLFLELGVGENLFHAGLGVVEVALNGADRHVGALLGGHLALLHGADAVPGVKHQDAGARHVLKALQGRLARIPRSGGEDDGLLPAAGFLQGRGEEVGQNLQSHVLKGAGGAVPKLQQ